jgi:hypothetical protein
MMASSRVVLLLGLLVLGGCGEQPDRIVSTETQDGRWELRLEARKNFLRPGESLAIRVVLESLAGQPAATFRDTIDFIGNSGSVSPSRLTFTFIGAQDTLYSGGGVTTKFSDWITYAMSSRDATAERQGEVSAVFRDLEVVLKIRIIED